MDSAAPFAPPIEDFYRTDPISRASLIMARCAEELGPAAGVTDRRATGTHG
jgi:NADH-quinone oxidoreductase subunit G